MTKKLKPTAGPWDVHGCGNCLQVWAKRADSPVGEAWDERSHSTTACVIPEAEARANAHLFAAAPELLAACRAVDAWLMVGYLDEDAENDGYNKPFRNALKKVRAAIKKATTLPKPAGE